MNFFDISFWIASALIIICIVGLIFAKQVKAFLIFGLALLFSVSSLFFLLGSGYIAFLHILFSVYLTGLALLPAAKSSGEQVMNLNSSGKGLGIIISSVFASLLTSILISAKWIELPPDKYLLPMLEITRILQSEYYLPLLLLMLIFFTFIVGIGYSSDQITKTKDR